MESTKSPMDGLINVKAASDMLGITVQTLRAWSKLGRAPAPAVEFGRLVRYRLTDIEAFKATIYGNEVAA